MCPALVSEPCRRRSPLAGSEGISPRGFSRWRGCAKRVQSPSAAPLVTATVHGTPGQAWSAATSGRRRPGWLQPLAAVGGLGDRADVCLETDGSRRGGTDHFREPPHGGRPPGGPARIAAILAQENRVAAKRGGLELADGLFTRPTHRTDGVVLDRRARGGGEIPRAPRPRQLPGGTPVRCPAGARFWGHERGGHDPTGVACVRQVPGAPIAAWSRFIDQDPGVGC